MARVDRSRVEDVLIAGLRRRHPDVREVEAAVARIAQVAVDDRVVHRRALVRWLGPEVAHRVEVRDVRPVCVRRGARRPILLHVHCKEAHVAPFDLLKGEHRARVVREIIRIVGTVPRLHRAEGGVVEALRGHDAHDEAVDANSSGLHRLADVRLDSIRERVASELPCTPVLERQQSRRVGDRHAALDAVLTDELLLVNLVPRGQLRRVGKEGTHKVKPALASTLARNVVVERLIILRIPRLLIERPPVELDVLEVFGLRAGL
mmetsp:Transcript_11713/g.30030  ORF Transcript_11713/g.30030 Transcript_11713/m.30030 type:complete len:263 (-) Transcript_11713:2241-3029(-)